MIYNLTHYDLDGICSAILIRYFLGETKIIPTGYNKINENFQNLLNRNPSHAIITDLNFNAQMINTLMNTNGKYLYIDHHKSNFKLPKESNVTFYIKEKYCAAANTLKYFKEKGKYISDEIKQLAYYANDYDTWDLKTDESQIMNFIFWKRGFNEFLEMFKNGYNEKIIQTFRPDFYVEQENIKKYLENSKKEEFMYDECKCLVIYTSQYINDVTLFYPNYDYYFIIADSKKMSVRTKVDYYLASAFRTLEDLNEIEVVGCHELAGGINLRKELTEEQCTATWLKCMDIILTDKYIPF
ncbi:MAG: DHH family phosphoesterase [Bacilli bacterium]|nr:DHH family phosphoesterase [Bacilli bacterium]